MEEPIKDYLAKSMLGKRFHFHCECIIPLNLDGTVCDYNIEGNEIVFSVDTGSKIILIGENHPNLKISRI